MAAALLFWPATAAGVLTALAGLILRRPSALILASVLLLPASLYLTATPRFEHTGLFPALFVMLAGRALRSGMGWIAWPLVVAAAGFFAWLALTV